MAFVFVVKKLQYYSSIMKTAFLFLISSSFCFTMAPASVEPRSSPAIHDVRVDLSNGIRAQVLHASPKNPTTSHPPIVFLHGSFHGPWAFQEHFFPFFLVRGHPVCAYAWRGTSGTFAGADVKKVKAEQHVDDLNCFFQQLPSILKNNRKPIVICHSFGGILFLKYLEYLSSTTTKPTKLSDRFAGIIMLSSVPPSGHKEMTKRIMKRSWRDTWKIVRGIPMKGALTNARLCRDLFFDDPPPLENDDDDHVGVSDEDLARFQAHFVQDSKVTVDTADLASNLPAKDSVGRAIFALDLPPALVIGATRDIIVDYEAVEEMSRYFGLNLPPTLVDSCHDSMLGRNWPKAAEEIHRWIRNNHL